MNQMDIKDKYLTRSCAETAVRGCGFKPALDYYWKVIPNVFVKTESYGEIEQEVTVVIHSDGRVLTSTRRLR